MMAGLWKEVDDPELEALMILICVLDVFVSKRSCLRRNAGGQTTRFQKCRW
jgi:hypothetical protein